MTFPSVSECCHIEECNTEPAGCFYPVPPRRKLERPGPYLVLQFCSFRLWRALRWGTDMHMLLLAQVRLFPVASL